MTSLLKYPLMAATALIGLVAILVDEVIFDGPDYEKLRKEKG